jgi:putative redox protein
MEKITFEGAQGARLAARLDRPDGAHRATALFAHCFSCSKDIAAARRISRRLASMGFAVLRFDFTGLGQSGGEFAETTFSSNVGDLSAAAAWLSAQGMAPGLLIGHSLGGAAALKAAGEIDSLRAVATIGAPTRSTGSSRTDGPRSISAAAPSPLAATSCAMSTPPSSAPPSPG